MADFANTGARQVTRSATYFSAIVLALAFVPVFPEIRACEVDQVRTWLVEYHSETIRAVTREHVALGKLEAAKPVGQLVLLYSQRDDSVRRLGGVFWASVCEVVDSRVLRELLLDDLSNGDPWWRAFACEALGDLGASDAIVRLESLLDDSEPVPGYIGDPTVAYFAAYSLGELGKATGVAVLLDYVERSRIWPPSLPALLEKLSGQNYGEDLNEWRRWWQEVGNSDSRTTE